MSAEPYTDAEQQEDVERWARSTPEQRAAAFLGLFTAASAVALNRQNLLLIGRIRDLRAMLNGGAS